MMIESQSISLAFLQDFHILSSKYYYQHSSISIISPSSLLSVQRKHHPHPPYLPHIITQRNIHHGSLNQKRPHSTHHSNLHASSTSDVQTRPPKFIPSKVVTTLQNVSYSIGNVKVIENISLDLLEGEIVCLLGPSGSGKSTLLRMVAGLNKPTTGKALYHDQEFDGVNPGAAFVFQNFALYPWLTVLENVELGIHNSSLSKEEKIRLAEQAIDVIGLDGYESAYPRELSGGMRQRVGFARALAVQPEILCMDEPFSALDVLTAENLRSELLRLWKEGEIQTKSILIVTHGIEEAVSIADRIIVLGKDPGHIRTQFLVSLPHPRNKKSLTFQNIVDQIYTVISRPNDPVPSISAVRPEKTAVVSSGSQGVSPAMSSAALGAPRSPDISKPLSPSTLSEPLTGEMRDESQTKKRYPMLPMVRIGSIAGLLAYVDTNAVDLYKLGQRLQLDVDDLYPVIDAGCILGLLSLKDGDVVRTDEGSKFVEANIDERKKIIRDSIFSSYGSKLIQQIFTFLIQSRTKRVPQELIFDTILLNHFAPGEARRQLEVAIEWGRFAEVFGYDAPSGEIFLDYGDVESDVESDEDW